MTRIYTTIHINRPVEQVFDYVTTSGNWPKWHPSSLGVRGSVDHPMQAGEQVTEEFLVAGRRGSVAWTVIACEPPRRWAIEGKSSVSSSTSCPTCYSLCSIGCTIAAALRLNRLRRCDG